MLSAAPGATSIAAQSEPRPVPPLTAHVTDLTGTLTEDQRRALEADLTALETAKGAQLAILMVPTTAPEDIAEFGIRVAEAWKLGRKGTDDGVILLVAKDDHRVRIEVGRGLEGAIPDVAAARVIREYLAPRFRENDFHGGLQDAVGALTKLISDEPLPPPLTDERGGGGAGVALMPALVAAWVAMLFLRRLFGRLPGVLRAGLVGTGGGLVGWMLSGLIPVGIGIGVLGLFLGLLGGGGGGGFARRGGWGGWGGWGGGFGGGFGGGGFGGGSFGGRRGGGGFGGFSGGGGGFAGGGASGRW